MSGSWLSEYDVSWHRGPNIRAASMGHFLCLTSVKAFSLETTSCHELIVDMLHNTMSRLVDLNRLIVQQPQ